MRRIGLILLNCCGFAGQTSPMNEGPTVRKARKYAQIPLRANYKGIYEERFWATFPYKALPVIPTTKIHIGSLATLLFQRSEKLTIHEIHRGQRLVEYLKNGAPALQRIHLPPLVSENHESAVQNGAFLTDTIADWINMGFVSGPFAAPPLPDFRSNQLKVTVRNGKVRPIINASHPIGRSLNDNIIEEKMEKVEMSSAQKFSYSIWKAGKGAIMSKFDMRNAYKNVPCRIEDIRLQGFQWGGKYFAETSQMFGARTAVANFDILGNTVLSLVMANCDVPKQLVHRQLDDVPVVGPAHSNWCENFTKEYEDVCGKIGVELAPECPKREKAFKNSTTGTVLGIEFESSELTWKLPNEKIVDYANTIHETLSKDHLELETVQSILGKLNFVSSMAPYMKTFKKNLQDMVVLLEESEMKAVPISEETRRDLTVWWAFIVNCKEGYPILPEPGEPPIQHKTLTSDAAGWKTGAEGSTRVGMGCVGLDEEGVIFHASQVLWDMDSVMFTTDSKGKHLGSKTTALEFTGIMIPFMSCLDKLVDQTILVQVDNIGCYYAWLNGYSSDNLVSILVRTLILITTQAGITVHIVHHPRESSWESKVADRLSREKSTSSWERRLVESFPPTKLPPAFVQWLKCPSEDWELPYKVSKYLFSRP